MAHKCHWKGCTKNVPPAMWGCKDHWFSLPKFLRDSIWSSYRAGQEITKTPSHEYIVIAELTQLWIDHYVKTGIKLSEKQFFGEHLDSLRNAATSATAQ